MQKDPELIRAVDTLRCRFGDTMVVVDHREGDLTAVGIARKGAEQRLAYISVKPGSEGPRSMCRWRIPRSAAPTCPTPAPETTTSSPSPTRQISSLSTLACRNMRTLPNQPLQLTAKLPSCGRSRGRS